MYDLFVVVLGRRVGEIKSFTFEFVVVDRCSFKNELVATFRTLGLGAGEGTWITTEEDDDEVDDAVEVTEDEDDI